MNRFEGKSVLVTGASRGLGRAIAEAFAREGSRVGIGYRVRRNDAQQTLAIVQEVGGSGTILEFDVQDMDAVESAVTDFAQEHGIDVLVNNAAIVSDEPFITMASKKWEQVLAVNLKGTFNCCQAVVRSMMAKKRGTIVNIASLAGPRASPGQANYAASKSGVMGLTATLGAELGPHGIRVNAVVPGLLTTGMGERANRRVVARRQAAIPLTRLGEAEEVAHAVLFLASEDASYIVGQCLFVDGGLSL